MSFTTRRTFISTTGAAAVTASLAPYHSLANHHAKRFTIGLSQYSLRAMFKDGSLDPLDYPAFTADTFGISAIDLWEGGLPKDKLNDDAYLEKMVAKAAKAKTEIFLLMTGALNADPQKSEASIKQLTPSIGRAKKLGCEFLRIFLRAPGKDEAAGLAASVEALKPLCDAAGKEGILIAIEPGSSELSQKGAFLAKVYQKVNHPALTLMPDFGKLRNNVYDGTEAMLPFTKTISCKMHSFDKDGNQPDFDYSRLMRMITASKYSGILSIEWEGHQLKPVPGVLASKALIERSLA